MYTHSYICIHISILIHVYMHMYTRTIMYIYLLAHYSCNSLASKFFADNVWPCTAPGREYQTGQLAQKRSVRQATTRSSALTNPLKNPLTSNQLRAITNVCCVCVYLYVHVCMCMFVCLFSSPSSSLLFLRSPIARCSFRPRARTRKRRISTSTHRLRTYIHICSHACIDLHDYADHKINHDYADPKINSHCNTLQHTAIHCNTLQHTATHCNTLQHTAHVTNEHCETVESRTNKQTS